MSERMPGFGFTVAGKGLLAVIAAAALMATSSASGRAAGPFDTTDPDYAARAARAVAQGKIPKQCLPSSATAPDAAHVVIAEPSPELIEAASKEGELVLNSGISDMPSVNAYQAAFEMRYPKIRMRIVAGGGASAEERFLADHAAGNNKVDGAISVQFAWVARALKEKAVVPLDQTIPGFFDKWPGGRWRWNTEFGSTAPAFYRSIGIAYNSDLVKGALIPKSYFDLARPEFKGQLLGLDPDAVGVYAAVWRHIREMVGDDTLRAIGQNLIKNPLYADVQPAAQALGAGAGMVLMEMGANVGQTMRASGAPVEVVMPEKTVGSEYAYVVASKALHPNAAKLFAHWLYSAEGQWVTSCGALAATVGYPAYGSKEFTATRPVPKDEVAKIKQLLGL